MAIEIDDSILTEEALAFVEQWASVLGVPVPVLLGRILEGAIDGDVYIEQRPGVANCRPLAVTSPEVGCGAAD